MFAPTRPAPSPSSFAEIDSRALAAELRAVAGTEVRFTDGDQRLYAYAPSIFQHVPIGCSYRAAARTPTRHHRRGPSS